MGTIQRSLAACILSLALSQGCKSNHGAADAGSPVDMTIPPLRDVLLVGNSYAGTVSFIDGGTFELLGWIDVIPDLQDRLNEIMADQTRSAVYLTIKQRQVVKHYEPGGGDRFVDDLFLSLDGKTLYVSRSNLGDVVAFDLTRANHPAIW